MTKYDIIIIKKYINNIYIRVKLSKCMIKILQNLPLLFSILPLHMLLMISIHDDETNK